MKYSRKKLTQARLKELLHYDPLTGVFTRLVSVGSRGVKGATAGCLSPSTGYLYTQVDKRLYPNHRLAFMYMEGAFPLKGVDHDNRVRVDNRWENLNAATQLQNGKNQKFRSTNSSGFMGVYWSDVLSPPRWYAKITVGGKQVYLGSFGRKKDAINARVAANAKYGFHPNHGGS